MVIQRKMEVIYSERDPRSAFKCEDVKVANILLCHGRQYKYWYILYCTMGNLRRIDRDI